MKYQVQILVTTLVASCLAFAYGDGNSFSSPGLSASDYGDSYARGFGAGGSDVASDSVTAASSDGERHERDASPPPPGPPAPGPPPGPPPRVNGGCGGTGGYGLGVGYGCDPIPMWLWPLIRKQQGQDGHDGEKGQNGWPGYQGDTGPQGPQANEKGSRGQLGTPGEEGPRGERNRVSGESGVRGDAGSSGTPGRNVGGSSAVYTKWGSTSCPETEETLYDGYAALPKHQDSGGGANFLCLPHLGTFHPHQTLSALEHSTAVGVTYNTRLDEPLSFVNRRDVQCVVCLATHTLQLMIPGTSVCPTETGWSTIYTGYLMSSRDSPSETLNDDGDNAHFRSKYICVSESPSTTKGTTKSDAEIFHVYLDCDTGASLECRPGMNEQLTCAVCGYIPLIRPV